MFAPKCKSITICEQIHIILQKKTLNSQPFPSKLACAFPRTRKGLEPVPLSLAALAKGATLYINFHMHHTLC